MNQFENAKQHFKGDDDGIEIQLPSECRIENDEERNIEDRTLTLDEYVLELLF